MSESDLALAVLISIWFMAACGALLLVFPSNIDRIMAWWERRRLKRLEAHKNV